MTAPAAPSAALPAVTPRRETSTLLLYIIGALLLAVAVAWVALSQRAPASLPSAPEAPSLQISAPAPASAVTRELALAELALQAGQLTEPPGQSALDFYRAALLADPGSAAAQSGMAGLALRLEARARDALAANRFAELDPLLNALREADPGGAHAALQTDIDARVLQRMQQIEIATDRGELARARALLEQVIAAPGVDLGAVATRLALVDEAQARLARSVTPGVAAAGAVSAQADRASPAVAQRLAELRAVNERPAVAPGSALAPAAGEVQRTADPVNLPAPSAASAVPPDAMELDSPTGSDASANVAALPAARTAPQVDEADGLAAPAGAQAEASQTLVAQTAPGAAADGVAAPLAGQPQAEALRASRSAAAAPATPSSTLTATQTGAAPAAQARPPVAGLTLPPAALAAADTSASDSVPRTTQVDAAGSLDDVRAAAAAEATVPALEITSLSGPGTGERANDAADERAPDSAPGAAYDDGADDAPRGIAEVETLAVAALVGQPPPGDQPPAATVAGADEVAAPATQALPAPPRDTRLIDALELARVRLSSGALIDPEYDSALFHFRQARALAPDNAQAAAGMETIFRSLTIRAVGAAAIADWDTADRLLDAAARLDGDLNAVVQAREQVLERRIAAESGTVLPMAELTRIELKAPRYPTRALHAAVEGWAMVEFTVAIDGTTTDIEVVGTSDRYGAQFARSAVQAVEDWMFAPRVFRGRKIPQRTSTRLTFDLDR